MKKLLFAAAALASGTAAAMDLMATVRLALENDPQFLAAHHVRDAGAEIAIQGRSGLLPSVSASASTQSNKHTSSARGFDASSSTAFNSNGWSINLTQPLFRWTNIVSYRQGLLQATQAEVQFALARQELFLRVTQAYFDILQGEENLRSFEAQKTAIDQQLAQAKENYDVGVATIVDVHEARSRFDLVVAQTIAAESELEVKRSALKAIIGREPGSLARLREDVNTGPPRPPVISSWVEAAERDAIEVQLQQLAVEIADKEVARNRAGHYPTIDVVASRARSSQSASAPPVGSGGAAPGFDATSTTTGLQMNLPIFQGGYVSSKTREAAANREAASQQLVAARRGAALAARQAYLGVVNGNAQVLALKAAVLSSRSSLESNRLGYDVGVRINIDVLNAEQQLYVTLRDLARARHETMIAQLRLKAAAGILDEADIGTLNGMLIE